MEIERKYLVKMLPSHLEKYPCHDIQQAYLCTDPVVRVRRSNEEYYLTYKSHGLLSREEYNMPLTRESYEHLLSKADGTVITKKRYVIPIHSFPTAELDIYSGDLSGLQVVEVEFESVEASQEFIPCEWFGEEITMDGAYQNSTLSSLPLDQLRDKIPALYR